MTATTPDDPYDALGPGVEVPKVQTPLSHEAVHNVLAIGHREAIGVDATPAELRAAFAMVGVEHGGVFNGERIPGAWIWCNNLGNISAALVVNGAAWAGDWTRLTAHEDIRGVVDITQRLRAHSSAIAGAADYWACMRGRFPSAVEAMRRGDLGAMANALRLAGYYTASPVAYFAGLDAWARVYDARFAQ